MHASIQNPAFVERKVPVGILVSPAKGAKDSGEPSEYSAVTKYWPGLSKTNPPPSLSEIILVAEISLYVSSIAKSEGEYALDEIRPFPCRGSSLPSGPFTLNFTNSPSVRRLTKIGFADLV